MSDVQRSSEYRLLIEAAKHDGPGSQARQTIWTGVSRSVAAAGAAASVAGTGFSKLLLTGTLFGGAATIGLAGALLVLRPTATPTAAQGRGSVSEFLAGGSKESAAAPPNVGNFASTGREDRATSVAGEPLAAPMADAAQVGTRAEAPPTPGHASRPERAAETRARTLPSHGHAVGLGVSQREPSGARSTMDPLEREASLLSAARAALAGGDAGAALRLVDAAKRVPGRQLVPEQLSIESQALRVLGRTSEADAVSSTLVRLYPDSDLAR